MCKKHNPRKIDECMKVKLDLLNSIIDKRKAEVVSCCCGHGKYPMTIIVKIKPFGLKKALPHPETFYLIGPPKLSLHYDLVSGKYIPRERGFYKKDKQGYYFIPEVLDNLNTINKKVN